MKKILSKITIGLSILLTTACGSQSELSFPIQPQTIPNVQIQASSNTVSFFRFDADNSEIKSFVKSKGLDKKGYKTSISKADLVYTNDNWQTTKTSNIQYLIDHTRGFILRGVEPNTEIEFAVHAWLCHSYDNFRSCADKSELWVNNNSKNYKTKTTEK